MARLRVTVTVLIWAMLLAATTSAGSGTTVKLVSPTPESFQVSTGSFDLSYDSRASNTLIVKNRHSPTGHLEVACAPGAGLDPLAKGLAKRIEYQTDDTSIRIEILSSRAWANFRTILSFPVSHPGLIHWKVEVSTRQKRSLPETDFDVHFGEYELEFEDLGKHNPAQVPLAYLYEGNFDATCLFYADYSTLNDYFILTKTRPASCVGIDESLSPFIPYRSATKNRKGFGYYRPPSSYPIPPQATLLVSNSYCYLVPGKPQDEIAMSKRFLRCLGAIYPLMTKPQTVYTHWPEIASRQIRDLGRPECWTRPFSGRRHLLPYVNHKDKNCNDLKTELQILTPLVEFNRRFPGLGSKDLEKTLQENVKDYYIPSMHTITNMIAKPRSSDPKDSFYAVTNAFMLGKTICRGLEDPQLREMFLDFANTAIRVGRRLDYDFPWCVDWTTGAVVNDSFWQHDVGGGFAYVFLQCYEITGDEKWLAEAKRAVESLRGHGFSLPHEIEVTAAGAAACAWLYSLTGDESYIDLSMIPLANVLRRCWFWDSQYDFGQYFKMFFAVSFAKNGPQVAPEEYVSTWDFLREYYRRTHKKLPSELHVLLPEFNKWALTVLRYFYPPLLAPEVVSPGPDSWPVNPELYVALEDMTDGSRKLGTVGQGIYMSRAAPELAAFAYRRLDDDITLFSEYNLLDASHDKSTNQLRFNVGGHEDYRSKVRLRHPAPDSLRPYLVEHGAPVSPIRSFHIDENELVLDVPGGSEVLIAPGLRPARLAIESNLGRLRGRFGNHEKALEGIDDSELTRDAFFKWYAEFSAWQATAAQTAPGLESAGELARIEALVELVAGELLGVDLSLDVESDECCGGDEVVARASLSISPDSRVQNPRLDLIVPDGWHYKKRGAEFAIACPVSASPGESATIRCRAQCEYGAASLEFVREHTIRIVPPVSLVVERLGGDFAARGKPYGIDFELKNHAARAREFTLEVRPPSDWTIHSAPRGPMRLGRHETRRVPLRLVPGREAELGDYEVGLSLRHADGELTRVFAGELVAPVEEVIDRGDNPSVWTKPTARRPTMPVRTDRGKLVFGPAAVYGVRQRELCLDVDQCPILSIKVDDASAMWGLFVDDGKQFPAIGIRLQQETWQTGVYHYDIRKATGWRGPQKFKLCFVISLCAPDRFSVVDWLVIGSRPILEEPK